MIEERAVLAGGCFCGMHDLIRRYDGVISTRVGYSGGDVPNATYRNHGTHAEAIEVARFIGRRGYPAGAITMLRVARSSRSQLPLARGSR